MNVISQTDQLFGRALWVYLPYVLLAPILLRCAVLFNRKLRAIDHPWLEWSAFNVKANLTLIPIRWRYVGLPYVALLMATVPYLALVEEWLFRTHGPFVAVVVFGAVHITMCITVRMTIWIMIVGSVLWACYSMDGLAAAFVVHAAYNLCAILLVTATRNQPQEAHG